MKTLYLSPLACKAHEPNDGHPECPERLIVVDKAVKKSGLTFVTADEIMPANEKDLLLAHTQEHIDHVSNSIPTGRSLNFLDADTVVCSDSKDAALHAVGAVLHGTKAVIEGKDKNAFCAVRPPGHHAHKNSASGFCLFNNVAIGALAALQYHGLKRVAILDYDVHHGNGTQDIVKDNSNIFFASTYQYPLDDTSTAEDALQTGINQNILNKAFPADTSGKEIVGIWKSEILPKIRTFSPEMIFVSAGFDGHCDDPLAQLCFTNDDYTDLMSAIVDLAEEQCQGRLVAVLEGGYNLDVLPHSVLACLKAMDQ